MSECTGSTNTDNSSVHPVPPSMLTEAGLQALVDLLRGQGYSVIAPQLRDAAIVYDEISHIDELPIGWTDRQEAGSYRVEASSERALFAYNVGPASWKRFFFPERVKLWQATRNGSEIELVANTDPPPRYALLGVRSCELRAIEIQDKVFSDALHADDDYLNRRQESLIIAVNCGQAGKTCFCVSMDTGPRASKGFDLSLTECVVDGTSVFLVETGSDAGTEILSNLPCEVATEQVKQLSRSATEKAISQMGRTLDTRGIKDLLQNNPEHPRWSEVASRCLSCANCTMVCPTCFCTTVTDVTDVREDHAERWRQWDSCFNVDFSYIHGGVVRQSASSRYRQWMTHKLAHWIDQFDSSGCVGCGRCITWCPVGIDITEEVAAIRATDAEQAEV